MQVDLSEEDPHTKLAEADLITKNDSDDDDSEGSTDESAQDNMVEGLSYCLMHCNRSREMRAIRMQEKDSGNCDGLPKWPDYRLICPLLMTRTKHKAKIIVFCPFAGSDEDAEDFEKKQSQYVMNDYEGPKRDYNGPQAGCTAVRPTALSPHTQRCTCTLISKNCQRLKPSC